MPVFKFPNQTVASFGIEGPPRRFISATPTFGQIRPYLFADPFNAVTQTGEQRHQNEKHAREIGEDMRVGKYTPTPITVGVRPWHVENMTYDEAKMKVELLADLENKLPVTDGWHRFTALLGLWNEFPNLRARIDACHIQMTVHLDPDKTKEDFLNGQKGLKMDASHLKSMKLATKSYGVDQPFMEWAREVALILNAEESSYLNNQIKFDTSRSAQNNFSGLTSMGGSDLSTSLTAGAKFCLHYENKDSKWAGRQYIDVFQYIKEHGSKIEVDMGAGITKNLVSLLLPNKVLCPKSMGGTKGGTGMLIGIGNVFIYDLLRRKKSKPDQEDFDKLLRIAEESLDYSLDKSFATINKRTLIGNFTSKYFDGATNIQLTPEGIPKEMCQLTAYSTWGAKKIAKGKGGASLPQKVKDSEGAEDVVMEDDSSTTIAASDTAPGFIEATDQSVGVEVQPPKTKKPKKGAPPVEMG